MQKTKDCEYCKVNLDGNITGKTIHSNELKLTTGYKKSNAINDWLAIFILKGKKDESAGLMLATCLGARYIDINYCPFCGRNLVEKVD